MNLLQLKAANPKLSIWVSASAGTGKTKILTDRVLRLLLKGEPFNKILCLTFTNAAAGEMKERIIHALSQWSSLDNDALGKELQKVLGKAANDNEFELARNLYNQYIRSEENINVQTIHSFCQKLLKKFPLEAGVPTNFTIIDDLKADFILKELKHNLLSQDELEIINDYLSVNFHELTVNEIFTEIIKRKSKFYQKSDYFPEEIYSESKWLVEKLKDGFEHIYASVKSLAIVQDKIGVNISTEELKSFFLTKEGGPRKSVLSSKLVTPGSNLHTDLQRLQQEIYELDQKERHLKLEYHAKLLLILAGKLLGEYNLYKSKKHLLDYDDLIINSCLLLNNSDHREWVLYKLDGFINHLLLDEAQDTSAEQWKIIDSLTKEFYSGSSASENEARTIFVVGDEKQSIFSFQGADVESFDNMSDLLQKNMLRANKNFENINLEISYRSAKEILDIVFHVFDKIKTQNLSKFTMNINQLQAFRTGAQGRVELWPLCKVAKEQQEFWPISTISKQKDCPKALLAEKISEYIKQRLASKEILLSTGKYISAGDFMVLFRTRDELTAEVIKSLQKNKIAVSGLDRIILKESLSVQDMLAIAKFILNPQDDLNLAALLKSPIFNMDDDCLQSLILAKKVNAPENSIWDLLCAYEDKYLIILHLLTQFSKIYNNLEISNLFQYLADIMCFREVLNAANGPDSNDAIDELIYSYQNYLDNEGNSLQGFLFWVEGSVASIKREINFSDTVKIMTVHASKGLQAPIVILCDTTTLPINQDHFIWDKHDNFLTVKNSDQSPKYYTQVKEIEQSKRYGEYLRLLYVGMTRAEDVLIVCGYQNNKPLPKNCWYELIRCSMSEIAIATEEDSFIYGSDESFLANVKQEQIKENIIEFCPEIEIDKDFKHQSTHKVSEKPELSPQFNQNDEITKLMSVSCSYKHPLSKDNPAEYGILFHKIMEETISKKAVDQMHSHPLIETLRPAKQDRIRKSISSICKNKIFIDLLNNDFDTELSIGYMDNGLTSFGRIDLIVYTEKEIIIIDYKSDLKPPSSVHDIPFSYKNQLLQYKNFIRQLYPQWHITTKILWLENGTLIDA